MSTHRNTDISARLGGEEFVIILPGTKKEEAILVGEKIRQNIEQLSIEINNTSIHITASFGVSTSCSHINIDDLLKNADKALYLSKFTGRNKVIHIDDNCIIDKEVNLLNNKKELTDRERLSGHILLAEDNITNQLLIGMLLDSMGLTYTTVSDGTEAVSMFSKEKFDLVLMDENMPNMSGTEAMKIIKTTHANQVPIIALTSDSNKEHFLNSGMDGYISKPIDNDELYLIISTHIKEKS